MSVPGWGGAQIEGACTHVFCQLGCTDAAADSERLLVYVLLLPLGPRLLVRHRALNHTRIVHVQLHSTRIVRSPARVCDSLPQRLHSVPRHAAGVNTSESATTHGRQTAATANKYAGEAHDSTAKHRTAVLGMRLDSSKAAMPSDVPSAGGDVPVVGVVAPAAGAAGGCANLGSRAAAFAA